MMKNIFTALRNRSVKWKIMVSILISFMMMSLILVFTVKIDKYALSVFTESYKSNTEIEIFSQSLFAAENAMENYVEYGTFESIDSYYSAASKMEEFCYGMQEFPSTNPVKQKEYIVNMLSQSFLFFSGRVISDKRAHKDETENFTKTVQCYNFLTQEISSLSLLLMEKSAADYETNRRKFEATITNYICFFAVFFMMILFILNFVIGSITKPLDEISKVALRIAKRDFDVALFNRDTTDEIGNICRAFDRMIISIREYIDTIWEKARTENELREKEMEMQALYKDARLKAYQSQINPHFLFNTLNTGVQLAMMEGADRTCTFIEQTSDFFRYNLQQQNRDATVQEELGLIDSFVYIMKVRFGDRLEFTKRILADEKDLQAKLPAMTLQPLVENCIKHGLLNSKGKVLLEIAADGEFLEISVSDNGGGFDNDIRSKILENVKKGSFALDDNDSSEHTGIGLINVFSRLKIYFHSDSVFDIGRNEEYGGTKFVIRIRSRDPAEEGPGGNSSGQPE